MNRRVFCQALYTMNMWAPTDKNKHVENTKRKLRKRIIDILIKDYYEKEK